MGPNAGERGCSCRASLNVILVAPSGVEPEPLSRPDPKSGASANSATEPILVF